MKNILRFILIVVLIIAGLSLIYNSLKPKRYKPANKVEIPITQNIKKTEINTPSPFTTPSVSGNFIPVRIIIPNADIDAKVEPVIIKSGQLQAPKSSFIVGWDETRLPGIAGTVIMDGHYDNRKGPAIFYNLQYLNPGDEIYIISDNKEMLTYKITLIEAYNRLKAPIDKIYGNDGKQRLNLITCHGVFDHSKGTYNQRLVVYSELEE